LIAKLVKITPMTSHPGGCGCETARVVLISLGDTKKKHDLIGIFIGDLWVLTIIYRGFMGCNGFNNHL
jgi:hypothetical protein